MGHTPSHISPKKWAWVLRRRLRDAAGTACRLAGERLRGVAYRLMHPAEARRTGDRIFLVYTMGKVASMSAYHGISRRLPHVRTFAMHYMMPGSLERQEEILKESIYRRMHTDHARRIRRCLEEHPEKEVCVVTLVREPVARAVSDLFQHLSLYREEAPGGPLRPDSQALQYPGEWTREELLPLTGIDILEEPFDAQEGFSICHKGRFSLLVVRYEDLDRVFGKAMEAFTGVGGWRLGERNRSSGKAYGREYGRFREELKLPKEELERVYGSAYARHFYTPEELVRFRERWR